MTPDMRIGVIGTGHVGLVTCVSMAALGHEVVGTDADEEKIQMLRAGTPPFFEPGLEPLLHSGLEGGRLSFSDDPAEAVSGSQVVFISVGTPPRVTGDANLVAVEAAGLTVARHATTPCIVVEKSTVPTGTALRLRRVLERERPDMAGEFEVASNPEFLREGSAIQDALEPERILVGADTERAHDVMRDIYRPLIEQGCEFIATDIASAELAKHASNAFLALKISFSNALARLCERSGADVMAVTDVLGKDSRIGPHFLNAGLGYGGSCFPKDLKALGRLASQVGYDFPLLREVERINDEAVEAALDKARDVLWNLEDKTIALLGLAFKPGTDDTRYSPALALAGRLIEHGAKVVGWDPHAMANAKADLPGIETAVDLYDAARGAHCVVICTEWDEVCNADLDKLRSVMSYPIMLDARNAFDPESVAAAGFSYIPTGRPRTA